MSDTSTYYALMLLNAWPELYQYDRRKFDT